MKITTILYRNSEFTKEINKDDLLFEDVQLVLGFGSGSVITNEQTLLDIQNRFPARRRAILRHRHRSPAECGR